MPAWRRRPDAQASAVEHARGLAGRGRGELRFAAASFKNSALTPSRALVRASVGPWGRPTDGSHLVAAVSVGFLLLKLHCRTGIGSK